MNPTRNRSSIIYLLLFIAIISMVVINFQQNSTAQKPLTINEVADAIKRGEVKRIVEICEQAGAVAKISSIHVNTWFGEYDKLTMSKRFFAEVFALDLDDCKEMVVFSGDSLNDGPMFSYFPHSVGVANVLQFINELHSQPAWVTENEGGYGFAEMVDVLLSER